MKRFYEAMSVTAREQRGQGMTEYIIVVAIIAIGAIIIVGFFGDAIRDRFYAALSILMGRTYTEKQTKTGDSEVIRSWKNWEDVSGGGGGS